VKEKAIVEALDEEEEEVLKNVQNMKMSVNYKTDHVYVLLMIGFKKKVKEGNIQIPLTLRLGHKSPRKEVLIYGWFSIEKLINKQLPFYMWPILNCV